MGRNDPAFLEAAREIAEEERKKHHVSLANELLRILDNGAAPPPEGLRDFAPLPKKVAAREVVPHHGGGQREAWAEGPQRDGGRSP
jgi:hypothetical protein